MIFEYLPLGTISNFISENEINYDFIKSVSSQLQNAISYLNKCGIVHRDIKLDNILCMHDNACNVNIKFIDIWLWYVYISSSEIERRSRHIELFSSGDCK